MADRGRAVIRGSFVAVAVAVAALAGAGSAGASELIDRNATGVKLAVNAKGQALLTYRARGRVWRVLAWGAVNARPPKRGAYQVSFKLDYSGGWGTYRKQVWKTFANACAPYDGPALAWYVAGCRAADGSYWAVQSWQRMLPNYGLNPTKKQAVWELRLSHWAGPVPELSIKLDWAYRRYDHLYGTYAYLGHPVFGFRVTPTGAPLDTWGRNLYLDTFNSAYGPGWKRENSFLAQNPRGNFCYGFYPHGNRPSGKGEKYRATIIGPGVAPDVYWESVAPGPYNRELDLVANQEQRELVGDAKLCRPN
jgi:hypothetical protein